MAENFSEYTRYKYAMENIRDIVWELDKNLIFTFVSPNTKELSGYEVEEMIGGCLLDFLSKESKEYVLNQLKQYEQNRIYGSLKKVILYDVQFVKKNRDVIWYEVSAKPLFKEEQFVGYIGMSRDISEKKEHENEVKKYITELEHANRRLDKLATYDKLTGAFNRRKFEQEASILADKKVNYGTPFAIIMFDIDFFKQVNDRYGHKRGDVILQEITSVVKNVLRETDKLFRWGGDEFIILLQETSIKNAYKEAEKVRKTIELYDFKIENCNMTISLGVGEYRPDQNIDQLIFYVDSAMLKAKSNGKNRVDVSGK